MIEELINNNLYSIIIGVFSLGGAWFVIQYKLAMIHEKFKETDDCITAMNVRVENVEKQQNAISKIETNLEWLIKAVEDIKKKLNIL